MDLFDTVVIGGGAAGLFCAAQAGQSGLRVLVLDHAHKLAQRIRISGGGRCNFTNTGAAPQHFLSENPHFVRSALDGYSSAEFIALVRAHGIAFHEKHRGQLFCDRSAQDLIDLLLRLCQDAAVALRHPCGVQALEPVSSPPADVPEAAAARWRIQTDQGPVLARHVVLATGGLAAPKMGASDLALRLAKQFGLGVVSPRPALVPLVFDTRTWAGWTGLAGLALPVRITTPSPWTPAQGRRPRQPQPMVFDEDLLFTHKGLSGPAILQISSYWDGQSPLQLDCLPDTALADDLKALTRQSRRQLGTVLQQWLPARLVATRLAQADLAPLADSGDLSATTALPDCRHASLERLGAAFQDWALQPARVEGWNTAEVMAGGVDTADLSSKSLEAKRHPGLYFIGECVDVTGWLGGYNFQWAWSSAVACARHMAQSAG
ncbi:NAD(P)/FAD-dependent oxidoreductase [Amphibiibacter pelophylacis]|uniref:Aminoacetone oxidase family FAD-binding enzyme n=1 Tax=Amphibiibacter pelophylacis TaxID=1799477 RepID=A0ACC6P5F6_9BURK